MKAIMADAASSVQIPLWTIVTFAAGAFSGTLQRSDSSMDDCNQDVAAGSQFGNLFRFLYGRL